MDGPFFFGRDVGLYGGNRESGRHQLRFLLGVLVFGNLTNARIADTFFLGGTVMLEGGAPFGTGVAEHTTAHATMVASLGNGKLLFTLTALGCVLGKIVLEKRDRGEIKERRLKIGRASGGGNESTTGKRKRTGIFVLLVSNTVFLGLFACLFRCRHIPTPLGYTFIVQVVAIFAKCFWLRVDTRSTTHPNFVSPVSKTTNTTGQSNRLYGQCTIIYD